MQWCLAVVAVALPATLVQTALLLGALLLVLVVELLNSAVEATVDRISLDDHELAKKAKDVGSAAVFVSLGELRGGVGAGAVRHPSGKGRTRQDVRRWGGGPRRVGLDMHGSLPAHPSDEQRVRFHIASAFQSSRGRLRVFMGLTSTLLEVPTCLSHLELGVRKRISVILEDAHQTCARIAGLVTCLVGASW